ncbi:hypothetical protein OSCI_3230024 [Kamptonema sp. PCC 6506]|nr:hypothetical protein OSCI_3230024 [Kamptonema sp. PCC 6506]
MESQKAFRHNLYLADIWATSKTIGGHPDSENKKLSLQLRDSARFTLDFPPYV